MQAYTDIFLCISSFCCFWVYLPNEGGVVVVLEILRQHLISEFVVLLYEKGLSILTPADNILVLLIL